MTPDEDNRQGCRYVGSLNRNFLRGIQCYANQNRHQDMDYVFANSYMFIAVTLTSSVPTA